MTDDKPTANDDSAAGFGIVPRHLRGHLKINEIGVYVGLSWRVNERGTCWLKHKTLADEIGSSVSVVQRALRGLREKGIVSWVPKIEDDGSTSCNIYTLHVFRGPRTPPGQYDRGGRSERPGGSVDMTETPGQNDRQNETPGTRPLERDSMNEERGGSSSSSVPHVPRESATPTTTEKVTPTDALIRAGLPASEHDRYIADLVRKGIANPAGCIIANHRDGELPDAVKRWRVATLVDDAEPDPDPTLCGHGNDVSLGDHMCSVCVSEREDPERRRDRLAAIASCDRCDEDGRLYNGSTLCSHEAPATGGAMPDFVRETLRNRPRLPGYGEPDTSTNSGVTPSILENVG